MIDQPSTSQRHANLSSESPLLCTLSPSSKREDCVFRLGEVMLLIKEVQAQFDWTWKLCGLCTNVDVWVLVGKTGIHIYGYTRC